jgi:hypothetical protein
MADLTADELLRAEATRRLADGFDIPPKLLDDIDSRGNCDSQRTIHRDAINETFPPIESSGDWHPK